MNQKNGPSSAFVGASWAALFAGMLTYLIGLWNATMALNEKGYYLTLLMYGLCWLSLGSAILLLTVGLWHASLAPSEKGFYAMSFLLALFAGVAVQKNIRDTSEFD